MLRGLDAHTRKARAHTPTPTAKHITRTHPCLCTQRSTLSVHTCGPVRCRMPQLDSSLPAGGLASVPALDARDSSSTRDLFFVFVFFAGVFWRRAAVRV